MKNILIVEDEPLLLNVLSKKLKSEGFKVKSVENGLEGLEKLEKEQFDLILLDVVMPEMDGITMLKKVRSSSHNSEIPVIMISNLEDPVIIAQAISLNSFDYLVKSDWSLSEIVSKIKERTDT